MEKNIRNSRIRKLGYILVTGLILAALLHSLFVRPVKTLTLSEKRIVDMDKWETETFQVDGKLIDMYSIRVPESIGNELVLCMKSYHAVIDVLLDGRWLYSFQNDYGERGICWKWIELPPDAAGQKLVLQMCYENLIRDPLIAENIYLGDRNTVFLEIVKSELPDVLCGGFVMLAGFCIWGAMLLLRKKLIADVRKGLVYLGSFLVLSGSWIITDSSVLQFVTGRTAVVTIISFCCFMLMPYSLLRFIRKMMVCRTKGLMILAHLHLINAAVCILLYLFRIVPMQQTLFVTHILILISVVFVVKEEINEIKKYNSIEMKIILEGMFVMIVFCEIALAVFYMNLNLPYSLFFGVGISVFACFLTRAAFIRIRYYLDSSAHAEEYREIAYMDSMTGLGNRIAFTKQQESGDWLENRSYIVMDLNDLKKVNDIQAHREGDKLIAGAGKCIKEAFGNMGKCYRIGGDEFAVISGTSSEEEIKESFNRLEQILARENAERTVPIEIAYGYAVRQDETSNVQIVFDEADARMYAKKQEMKAKKAASDNS